jgi:hypothetical protein
VIEPVSFFVILVGVGTAFVYSGVDIAMNAVRNPPRF